MTKYVKSNKKGIILVLFGVLFLTIMVILHNNNNKNNLYEKRVEYEANIIVREPETQRELSDAELIDLYLAEKEETIVFLAKTFQIDKDILEEKLIAEEGINLLDIDNFDYFLIEYLFVLENSDKTLFDNSLNPCQDSKEYIVALIRYFTNIYEDVDFTIAAGIAQIESNYTATSMLNKNNIFGGMYNGSLIKYKNIEYGVLRYIKLLNDGYFKKGLTTVATIGKVYNPTYNENGEKIAKPSWVANVTNAMQEFSAYDELVDITLLNNLKTNS